MKRRQPVQMVAHWVVPAPRASAMVAAVHALITATRREHGCLSCSLSTEVREAVVLTYRETWASEHALRDHVASEQFAAFAGLLEAAVAPPQVAFELQSGTRGLDFASEVQEASRDGGPAAAEADYVLSPILPRRRRHEPARPGAKTGA